MAQSAEQAYTHNVHRDGKCYPKRSIYQQYILRPRKPEGSLGRTAQDGHLDSHTAPEL